MTLIKRDTLIDRPELVNRDEDSDEETEQQTEKQETESDTEVQRLGDGGDVTVHNIEFSEDDLDIVGAANTAAVLTTGQDSGEVFEQMFANAAVQLKDMKDREISLGSIFEFGLANSFATVGVSDNRAAEMVQYLTRSPGEDLDLSDETDIEQTKSSPDESDVDVEVETQDEETSEE